MWIAQQRKQLTKATKPAMEGASSSKTALKRGADRESTRSTNSASPTRKRQRPNDEQSGNLGLTDSCVFMSVYDSSAHTSQSTVVVRWRTQREVASNDLFLVSIREPIALYGTGFVQRTTRDAQGGQLAS